MKLIIYLCVSLLCFCHYSGNQNNAKDSRNTSVEVNRAADDTDKGSNVAPLPKKGDLKINVYRNNQLTAAYIYDKNTFQEAIYPNSEDGNQEGEENPVLRDFADKVEADNVSYYEFLVSKNIKIPFPEPIFGKISDTAKVLTLLEDDSEEIKKETSSTGDKKTIKFTNINDYIRFYPSEIPSSVYKTEKLKNYELNLTNDYLSKETYQFQKSKFVRRYFYEENKLIKLISTAVVDRKTEIEETRFEYQKLNPNQELIP